LAVGMTWFTPPEAIEYSVDVAKSSTEPSNAVLCWNVEKWQR
jgi:hypothetical protein